MTRLASGVSPGKGGIVLQEVVYEKLDQFRYTYTQSIISASSGLSISRLLNNSGQAVLIVKYMSSFLLHFSNENLQPLKNVIMRLSSENLRRSCE